MIKKRAVAVLNVIILAVIIAGVGSYMRQMKQKEKQEFPKISQQKNEQEQQVKKHKKQKETEEKIEVTKLDFKRLSKNKIKIIWKLQGENRPDSFIIKRRTPGENTWKMLGTIKLDGTEQVDHSKTYAYTDELENSDPQQFIYRIDVKIPGKSDAKSEEHLRTSVIQGAQIMASNIIICVDPGHYARKNEVYENGAVVYCEGDFTLQLAKKLRHKLKEKYGVTTYLTRTTRNICIRGFENMALDASRISLRGEAAKGMNLFVSLHTNANLEHANGTDTNDQPEDITKPIIIVNAIACEKKEALKIANAIGINLAEENWKTGLGKHEKFHTVSGKDDILNWTDAYNDSVDKEGTVCVRWENNRDYYGVLRGASSVSVPGMIIEHGFHTVKKMRTLAASGTLDEVWADADARGIAKGMKLKED